MCHRSQIHYETGAPCNCKEEVIESKDMTATAIQTDQAPKAVGPYSQAVIHGNLVFCSGQLGIDPTTNTVITGGVEAQATQTFKNIAAVLKAAGTSLSQVVRVDLFLADINDFAKVNDIYSSFFSTDPKPARQTIQAAALPKGALIEISAIAAI